jgi:cell division septation protein DedD
VKEVRTSQPKAVKDAPSNGPLAQAPAEEASPEAVKPSTPAVGVDAAPDVPRPYTLQVGSFSQQTRARELVVRLQGAGHDAYMVEVDLGSKGVWWRVRVGHFETAQSAKWAKLDLVKLGVSPIVIRDRAAASP